MDNIILIGFMGSGKTTVGIRLSYLLRIPMTDTDKLIEKKEGRTISEIFAADGEMHFRELETQCLEKLLRTTRGQILSVGGGLPVQKRNHALLRQLGCVVYLRAKAETIYERLKEDTSRPLLQGDDPQEKIRRLLGERESVYEATADVIVDVDGKGFDEILEEITQVAIVRERLGL